MTAEIGQFALILAFVLALVQSIAQLWGAARNDAALMSVGRNAVLLQAAFILAAFVCLATLFATNDFSVALVVQHSNSAQPLIYRLGATWGSHEGSMLLWVLILAVYGAGVALFPGTLRDTMRARVLGVQGLLGAAFLGFLIFTSNPFSRLFPAPLDGGELNPILQDPGLVFHPPMVTHDIDWLWTDEGRTTLARLQRDRPPLAMHLAPAINASFPSGHATLSATVFLTLGALIAHFAQRHVLALRVSDADAHRSLGIAHGRHALGISRVRRVLQLRS
jgi:hypothetical protein